MSAARPRWEDRWDQEGTPPLDTFLPIYEANDNVWWAIGCGHHQNLFDDAVEQRNNARSIALKCAEQVEQRNRLLHTVGGAVDLARTQALADALEVMENTGNSAGYIALRGYISAEEGLPS